MAQHSPETPGRGLVVEDLPASAEWLGNALEHAFPAITVSCAATLAQARERLRTFIPDIALIDLDLPDGSGVELIHALGKDCPDCPCIVTTIFADDRHLFPALRAGAHGYLLKDQPLERVVSSLQAISAGEPPLSPTIANRLLRVFSAEQSAAHGSTLSTRETDTLILISKGLKLSDVATHLNITRNTAAGYVKGIYRKLKISTRAEAVLEAARLGLVRTDF